MACLLLSLGSLSGYAQALPQDPKLTKGILPNGMTYYIYQLHEEQAQTAVQLFVNAGSLQETEEERGVAHFLEHMAFNGTQKYPGHTLISILEEKGVRFGSHLNAHTGFDETVYKLNLEQASWQDLLFALDVAAQWAFHISLDSAEVADEIGIIIEEWRGKQGMGQRLSDAYIPLIFKDSRHAERQPIGLVDVIRGMDSGRLRSFYEQWYRPELMAVAVVTNHDPREVEKEIGERFGARMHPADQQDTRRPVPDRVPYALPLTRDTLAAVLTEDGLSSIEFSYFKTIPAHRKINHEKALLQSLHQSAFNSLASKRFSTVIQQGGLPAKSGSTSVSGFLKYNGVVSGSADLFAEEIENGIRAYWQTRKQVFDYGFTQREIREFREQYLARLARTDLSARSVPVATILERLKDDFMNDNTVMGAGDRSALISRLIQEIDSVSLVDFAKNTDRIGQLVLLLTAPTALEQALPDSERLKAWLADVERTAVPVWEDREETIPAVLLEEQPAPGRIVAASQLEPLQIPYWQLSNGTRVFFKHNDQRKNYITMTAFRRGGVFSLDTALYLPASYVRDIVSASGAGLFSRNGLSTFLQGNSASATLLISEHREGVAASANMEDVATLFELMYLKWTRPNVDTGVFSRVKRRLLSDLANRPKHTALYTFNQEISKLLRTGQPELGEVDASRMERELTREAVLEAYTSRFGTAEGFDFVIVGDVDIETLKPLVLRYIGGLPGAQISRPIDPRVPAGTFLAAVGQAAEAAVSKVTMHGGDGGKAVVQLIFQSEGQRMDYPGLLIQRLTEEVLKVRLRQYLREGESGVYSVSVQLSATNKPDPLVRARVGFTCDPERRDQLIALVYQAMEELSAQPSMSADLLANAKLQLTKAYEREVRTNTFWSSELRNHLYQGYENWAYLENFGNLIQAVGVQDLKAYMDHYLLSGKRIEAVLLPAGEAQDE